MRCYKWGILTIPETNTRLFQLLRRVSSQELTLVPLVIEEQCNCFSYLHYLVIFEALFPLGATSFGRPSKSSFSLKSCDLERSLLAYYLRKFLDVWTL